MSNIHCPDRIRAALAVSGLWLAALAPAQNSMSVDSLRAVLAAHPAEDSNRVNTLSDLSAEYWDRDLDSAFSMAEDALHLSERLAYSSGVGKAYNSMGVVRWYQGNYTEAQRYLELALKAQEATGHKNEMKAGYHNLGLVYDEQGDYPRALEYYLKAMKLSETAGDEAGIMDELSVIAIIHLSQHQNDTALKELERVLRVRERTAEPWGLSETYSNLGNVHDELGHEQEAEQWYDKALALREKIDDQQGLAISYNNLGNLYAGQHQYDKALAHFEKAMAINERLGYRKSVCAVLLSMANVYDQLGDRSKALQSGKRALEVAEQVKTLDYQHDALKVLSTIAAGMADFRAAYGYRLRYEVLNDSIFNAEKTRALVRYQMRSDFDRQQLADSLAHAHELAHVEEQRTIESLRADRNQNRALAFGGGAILLLGGAFALFRMDRHRRQVRFEKDAAQLETQALRSQMNPHFIFNALNSINAFIQTNDRERATTYLGKFARLMRLVLENSRKPEVSLKDDLEALDLYLNLERARSGEKFDYSLQVDPDIDQDNVLVPPLVIQPFVENAIWHGMAGKEGKGHITLSVHRNGAQLVMVIEDDGVGRNAPRSVEGTPKKSSLATAITRARLDLIGKQKGQPAGFSYMDLAQGTRVEVSLPLSEVM
jgi:tetratricopeptide (TPR) repeat protein